MVKALVAPSILSGDFGNMASSVKSIENWGGDIVHVDVMDGVYVPNITFGMPMVKALRKVTKLPLDVHLMITEPEKYVVQFVESGADFVTFHPDASKCPEKALDDIRKAGAKCGIVFNPNVPFEKYSYLLEKCDMVLIMSVYAGFGGQSFIQESLNTVKKVKEYISSHGLNIPLEIDGGVCESNAGAIKSAGVDILVAGSAVFKSSNPAETIKKLKECD